MTTVFRIMRMKNVITPRGRTCTGGGSVRGGAPLPTRAQARAALGCFHSEFIGQREEDAFETRRNERKKPFCCCCVCFRITFRCNVSSSGRFGAALRDVGGDLCSQEFAGAGGCSGENEQRQMHIQVPHSAHDPANRCFQTPPGTEKHFAPNPLF